MWIFYQVGVLTLIAHYIELYSLASSVSLNAKIPEGILLLTISSCIHLLYLLSEGSSARNLLLTISSCIHEDESHELESIKLTYCSLYRAVFTYEYIHAQMLMGI